MYYMQEKGHRIDAIRNTMLAIITFPALNVKHFIIRLQILHILKEIMLFKRLHFNQMFH